MNLALAMIVMRFVDFMVIYLALGAPIATHVVVTNLNNSALGELFILATRACLFWPGVVVQRVRGWFVRDAQEGLARTTGSQAYRRIVEGGLNRSLSSLSALLKTSRNWDGNDLDEVIVIVDPIAETLRKYVELSLACREASTCQSPGEHELEFCKVSGVPREDIETTARCLHRRNIARLHSHLERARSEMVDAMTGLRSSVEALPTLHPYCRDENRDLVTRCFVLHSDVITLAELLGDERAASELSRELNRIASGRGLLEPELIANMKVVFAEEEPCVTSLR
jgi:hypothetical protein